MTDIAADLPTFPMPRACPFQPPKDYAEMRETAPVTKVMLPSGMTSWVITSHELVRQILADERVSSDRTLPGCPRLVPVPPAALGSKASRPLIALDPPEHTTHRRMVTNEFTVKRIQAMRPRIQEIVDDQITEMLASGQPADLVAAIARPVPARVICELLGVPYEDRHLFHRISDVIVNSSSTPPEIGAAMGELRAFLAALLTAKEKDPGEDLFSRLVVRYQESGEYDQERVISTAQILLNAGHESTANMIGLGTLGLLENPDQLALLRDDPSIAPQAVEELLRYFSVADKATFRTAIADIEIGGVVIKEGDGLIALGAAANHDPSAYAVPEQLDLTRNSRQHLAFGHGIHQCIGQNLARLELEIVFTTLLRRVPGLRLAVPVDDLRLKNNTIFFGVHELPVAW